MGKLKDETGNRYGNVVVVSRADNDKNNNPRWLCKCDCGGEIVTLGDFLRRKARGDYTCRQCRRINITSMKFGRLLVLSEVSARFSKHRGKLSVLSKCDCGKTTVTQIAHLVSGNTVSCGCYNSDRASRDFTAHGCSKDILYDIWRGMIKRCEDPKHPKFELYYSKGRTVCKEWRESYESFKKWCMDNGHEKGLDIDRRDNSRGYSPDNCRFVTRQINIHNCDIQRRNKTGYKGVYFRTKLRVYEATVGGMDVPNGQVYLGRFATAEQAVEARNNYIRNNKLPHHRIQEVKNEGT